MNRIFIAAASCLIFSCSGNDQDPKRELIASLNLKKGDVIACGATGKTFGTAAFKISGDEKIQSDFNLGVNLLHSFEYDEAEKVFAKVIDADPDCAMAYWGVAMSNFHALWSPPSLEELKKGTKAIEIAKSISGKTKREEGYIDAIAAFYKDADKLDHRARCIKFENAMKELNARFPDDKETAIFYALALTAAADPTDKTFAKQKKAGEILNSLYPGEPNHPGIVHYIIHTYDSPELANLALPAARKYASVAPASAHALHMPSHIFTRLGLWEECIQSNINSVNAAQCYAEAAGIKGHWDEELHGLDYLMYAYLQRGDNEMAKKQLDYLKTIKEVHPLNFKVAYAFAAIPSRYVLENKLWNEAATLRIHIDSFSWKDFQWQKAILHFTRALGNAHLGNLDAAKAELDELNRIHAALLEQKDAYKAGQVDIQAKAAEAWICLSEGRQDEALRLMELAASMEEKTEKHPVTPSEVLPARELLGDMLMKINQPAKALVAYEEALKKHPNRFNGVYGAGTAAEKSGKGEKANFYYKQLLSIKSSKSNRSELKLAEVYLGSVAGN